MSYDWTFQCSVAQWDDKDNQGWKYLGIPLGTSSSANLFRQIRKLMFYKTLYLQKLRPNLVWNWILVVSYAMVRVYVHMFIRHVC